ncbi:hypothetical protein E2562_035720 [Oryza meyeriana var. granulata]|uniref:Uncharacterized protein n=1 Tax=Oryza meyeriana var. granulata TaxID=110450 RepID=A0A6G1E9F7_9ORYZ|nr:hypothetical protein E2562_035720 [Oryza meyeriana var. granulata]
MPEQAMREMEAVYEEFFRLMAEDEGIGDRAATAVVQGHGAPAGLLRRPAAQLARAADAQAGTVMGRP